MALLGGASAISLAPVFVRLSLGAGTGPVATAFWRMAFACPAAWLVMAIESRRTRAGACDQPAGLGRGWRRAAMLLLPGLFFAGDLGVWHVSIAWTTVANATLLANFAPIFVAVAAWLLLRERLRWFFAPAMMLALGGAALVLQASFTLDTRHLWGDVLGLVTALFYAAYQLAVKWLRRRHRTGMILFWSSLSCATVLLVITLSLGEQFTPVGPVGWAALVALALVSHIGGQGLIAYSMAHLPVSFASVSLLWQPMLAAVVAWQLFGERIGSCAGFGALMIGILLARLGSRESTKPDRTVQPSPSPCSARTT